MATTVVVNQVSDSLSFGVNNGNAIFPVNPTFTPSQKLSAKSGTGAGKVGKVYANTFNVAPSGTTTLDLTSLTDPLGAALDFSTVFLCDLYLTGGTGQSSGIKIQPDASNGFCFGMGGTTPFIPILNGPDGGTFKVGGFDGTGHVVDTTHKILDIVNLDSVNAANGTIYIFGN